MTSQPSMRLPIRRLRALFPLAVWAGAAVLHPEEPLWTSLVGVLGLVGGAAVWFGDRSSPLDRMQRRFPTLGFRGVDALPSGAEEDPFEMICSAVVEAHRALDNHPRRGRDARRFVRKVARELDDLVVLGARLAVQLESLQALPVGACSAGVLADARRAADRLDALPRAADELRDAVWHSGSSAGTPYSTPPASLRTLRRELHARAATASEPADPER